MISKYKWGLLRAVRHMDEHHQTHWGGAFSTLAPHNKPAAKMTILGTILNESRAFTENTRGTAQHLHLER